MHGLSEGARARPGRRRWHPRGLFPVIGGAVFALGQAPFGYFWLAVPALAYVIALGASADGPRQAGWIGWRVGLGFGLVTFVWIVEPFLVDPARDGWLAPFALFGMSAGIGLFWALGFWTARRVTRSSSLAMVLAIPAYLALVEMLRSYAFGGFPWGLTAYIWIDTPVYQMARLTGPHGLTLATLVLSGCIAESIARRRRVLFAVCLVAGAAAYAHGAWQLSGQEPAGAKHSPVARLIQPNAIQKQKWDPAFIPVFFERQLRLTSEPGERPVDLVIWPEVAVPYLLNDPDAPFDKIARATRGAPVVIGAQRLEQSPEGRRAYNSLAVIEAGGVISQIYDKHHLVPFGEFIPARGFLERLGIGALAAKYGSGYSAGPGPRLIHLGPLGRVLPLICYEAIFPHEMRRVQERPDWMLMVTNDAWFGEAVGPYQHFAQARARTIEFGLPMLRVANTGISAAIDARGRVLAFLPLGVDGKLDVPIPAALAPTFYWRFGDTPALILMIVLALTAMGLSAKNRIDRDLARM